jgi:hypothetical protein
VIPGPQLRQVARLTKPDGDSADGKMVLTLHPDGDVRTAVAEVVDPSEFEIDV